MVAQLVPLPGLHPTCPAGIQRRAARKGPAMQGAKSAVDRQLPIGDEIFLDHVGHFVRDPEAASRALGRAGFAPTPISVQVNPVPAGGAPRPTGTGNVTAMLRRGYFDMLFHTADKLRGGGLESARRGKLVVAPFPAELGEGTWCFVETAAHLPWRA